jgi:hypothetical protein
VTGSSITFTGTLAGATLEDMETNAVHWGDDPAPDLGSVWWTWTAPQSSTVVIQILRDYSIADTGGTQLMGMSRR